MTVAVFPNSEGGVIRVGVEEVGEARRAVNERLHPHEPVVAAGQMRSDAGMGQSQARSTSRARTGLSAT